MSTRDELLRTIIEFPDDDTPRLVFADWLDEHGDPERAEFIRVQCELARLQRDAKVIQPSEATVFLPPAERRAKELYVREMGLLLEKTGSMKFRWDEWKLKDCGDWQNLLHESQYKTGIKFVRGFVEAIACTWADWLANHEQILKQTPLKNVNLTTVGPIASEGRILEIEGMMDDLRVATLERHWPRLKFTLPSPLVTVDFSGARTITLPPGWVIRQFSGSPPSEVYEGFRQGDAVHIYYGDGATPSVATAPPAPPSDPSSDAENTEP